MLILSLFEAVEDSVKLRLAWIQAAKDAVDSSSPSIIPTNKGMVIQTALTPPVKEMMDFSSFPIIQEPKDSIKPLQILVQAPKDSAKPTEIPAQVFEVLMKESQSLVQRLKVATTAQVGLNQLFRLDMDSQLLSCQRPIDAESMESGSIQMLMDALETLSRWCQTLQDMAEI